MSSARKVGKEAVPITIGRVLSYLLNFVILIILNRVLGPYYYGIFSLGVSIVLLFNSISHLGIETALPYFIPKLMAKKQFGKALWTFKRIFRIRAIMAIVLSILLFALSKPISLLYNIPLLETVLQIMAIGFVFYSILFLSPVIFQAFKKKVLISIPDLFFSLLRLISLLLTISLGFILITVGYIISIIVSSIISLILINKILPKVKPIKTNFSKVWDYAKPIYLSVLVVFVVNNVSGLLMGLFPEHNAYLNIAQRSGLLVTIPAISLAVSLFPELSGQLRKTESKRLFSRLTRYTILFSAIACFYLLTIAKDFIIIFFGSNYLKATLTIQLMMFAFFFSGAFSTTGYFFMGSGKPKKFTIALIVQALLNTSLIVLLLNYRSLGAAFAMIMANLVYGLLLIKGINYPKTTLIRSLIVGFLSSSASLISTPSSIINLIVCSTAYISLFTTLGFLFKLIDKQDVSLFYKSIKFVLRKSSNLLGRLFNQ